jgi:hypothetical protein
MNIYIDINIICLVFSCLGISLSVMFFLIICTRIRPIKSNIPLVLTCHTYLSAIITSIIVIELYSRTIFNILNPSSSLGNVYCQIRAYFLYVSFDNVIYSFVLQAIFRLFRVVFYQRRALRTFNVFTIAIFIQWIFISLIHLPFFPLHDLEYLPSEHRCVVNVNNIRGSVMILLFAYIIPSTMLFTIYFFIIRHVRQTNLGMQHRQNIKKRDIIVFKRIILLFIVLQVFSIPLAVVWLVHIITSYSIQLTYQLQGLTTAFILAFIPIVVAFGTPQIQEKFIWTRRRRQVHPVIREEIQPHVITEKIRIQRF